MSKINDITKKAALVAGMGLAAYGTAYAADGADNGALTGHSIETNDGSHAKEVNKMIEAFKNQADIEFKSKDGINMNNEKLHTDEWGGRLGSITERTFEDGSMETQIFSEHCNIIMKDGKFFTKNGEAMRAEDAMKKIESFKKDNNTENASTVFMKTLNEQKQGR